MKTYITFLAFFLVVSCSHMKVINDHSKLKKKGFGRTHREMRELRHGFYDWAKKR